MTELVRLWELSESRGAPIGTITPAHPASAARVTLGEGNGKDTISRQLADRPGGGERDACFLLCAKCVRV